MYKILCQHKDHFVETVAKDIASREEAEYILAEYVMNPKTKMLSHYIVPQKEDDNEIQRRKVIVL